MVSTHFMDDAEHCDQIGFIFEGRLIADDTPEKLKNNRPGLLLQISTIDPIAKLDELSTAGLKIADTYPYGNNLYVLIDPNKLDYFSIIEHQQITLSWKIYLFTM